MPKKVRPKKEKSKGQKGGQASEIYSIEEYLEAFYSGEPDITILKPKKSKYRN